MRQLVTNVDRSIEEARRRRLGIPLQPIPQTMVAGRMKATRIERHGDSR